MTFYARREMQGGGPSTKPRGKGRPSPSCSPLRFALLAVAALFLSPSLHLDAFDAPLSSALRIFPVAQAKEIVATREWQLLGENDTIPAGLHVRMDLSTGQKWAKIASDERRDEGIRAAVHDGGKADNLSKVDAVEVDASGEMTVVETNDVEASNADK